MKVLYDFQAFGVARSGGVQRYFTHLMGQIAIQQLASVRLFSGLTTSQIYSDLTRRLGGQVTGIGVSANDPMSRVYTGLNRLAFNVVGRLSKTDVYHPTYFTWLLSGEKSKRVITVHDMNHELLPHLFSPRDPTCERKKFAVEHADGVICVSENTRKELLDIYPIDPQKTVVIHHGTTELGEPDTSPLLTSPYFLFVGHRGGYKNFSLFVKAFSDCFCAKKDVLLVCAGGGSFSAEELQVIQRLRLVGRVRLMLPSDQQLATLYRHAVALVYPSRHEGFGLPLLEAMRYDCPVVAANNSSLPEVGGDAVLYYETDNDDELGSQLLRIHEKTDLRRQLQAKGRDRWPSFTWQECARRTSRFYASLVG